MNHDYEISDQADDKLMRLAMFVADRGSEHISAVCGNGGRIMTARDERLMLVASTLIVDTGSEEFERLSRIFLAKSLTQPQMSKTVRELDALMSLVASAVKYMGRRGVKNVGDTFINKFFNSYARMLKAIDDLSESYAAYNPGASHELISLLGNRGFEIDFDRMTTVFDVLRARFYKIDPVKTDEMASTIDRINRKFSLARKHNDNTDWRATDNQHGILPPPKIK